MIAGIFHEGSGLGDQLFRYITVRSLAEKKGYEWGMTNPNRFKGSEVFNLDYGRNPKKEADYKNLHGNIPFWDVDFFNEKDVRDDNGNDIRSYDPEINFVHDNTVIDGSFEDDKYWRYNLKNINKWLKVEPVEVPDDTCLIGFRGGEYAGNTELFLGKDYYQQAIFELPESVQNFQVHTDDPELARQFFPDYEIVENSPISHSKHTNMAFNWRSMRSAKYAIIPNSAFFILPRILKHFKDKEAVTIAPRYWARRNTRVWARPACYYPEFKYL